MKLLSLFSGIGAYEKALSNVGIEYDLVNYCEWDTEVSRAYSVLHNTNQSKNLGDIKKVDEKEVPDHDLMTYSFPCQDLSVALPDGQGFTGSRSSMLNEALRVANYKRPKYLLSENVPNMLSRRNLEGFHDMLEKLNEIGYNNYYTTLDAKHFQLPQERKRVFVVSIRKDVDDVKFTFPSPRPTTPRTSSWWEFLDISETRDLTNRQRRMVNVAKGINKDDTIKFEGKVQFDKAVITLRQSGLRFQANDHHPTVTSYYGRGGGNFTILAHEGKIGGITPKQCLQLMGFDEEDYTKLVDNKFSNSYIYQMAGNSVAVPVLEDIFKNLLLGGE